jgi:hypothetical protein
MIADKVIEKWLNVCIERTDLAGRNKGIDSHVSVQAAVKAPSPSTNIGRCDWGTANGSNWTKIPKPGL